MSEQRGSGALSDAQARKVRDELEEVLAGIGRVIVGKDDVIRLALVCLASGGHLLFKDVPGTGKTLLARSIAASVQCSFRRLQMTPDLLPLDVTGSKVFNLRDRTFSFQPGPVFTHVLLADELNRASPKTQSALLEAMAEGQVTVEGDTYPLEKPFLVMATMNPLDHEGTYPLPAAELDRFTMQLALGFPAPPAEVRMLDIHLGSGEAAFETVAAVVDREEFLVWQKAAGEVFVSREMKAYLVAVAGHLRQDERIVAPPSPRSVIMLARASQAHALAEGRPHVEPRDVRAVAPHVLSHRLVMESDRAARACVEEALERVPLPR